ncbi:MAG: hypothetical protein LBS06_04675 [Treponema sp.]|jgi:hypothetical protein|nr:hypothetical protein [Treponema sp.]
MEKTPGIIVTMLMALFLVPVFSTCDFFEVSLVDYLQEGENRPPNGEEDTDPWVYVAVNSGNDANAGLSSGEPVKSLGRALDIRAGGGSAEVRIMLTEDIAVSSGYSDPEALTGAGLIDFSTNLLTPASRAGITAITLAGSGSGKTIDNKADGSRPVLYINTANKVITLKNLTIKGGRGDHGAGIHVGAGAALIMGNDVVIAGNGASVEGGGVYVDGVGSKFTMTGGEIRGNEAVSVALGKGGGVCVGTNGTFIMKGGTISANESGRDGGGVYVGTGGTFTMEGGTVKGNRSGIEGGGVYISGAGSKARILNGGIGGPAADDGNRAKYGAGVYVGVGGGLELGAAGADRAYPAIQRNVSSGGGSPGSTGGGIIIDGSGAEAIFHHGTVHNNNGATMGGGILVVNGKLDMRGGTVTGNTANAGPGIAVGNDGSLYMSGGARVLDPANPVHLYGTSPKRWITIGNGGFTGTLAPKGIAIVTTNGPYGSGTTVLKREGGGSVAAWCDYFNVDGKGFGSSIDANGEIKP